MDALSVSRGKRHITFVSNNLWASDWNFKHLISDKMFTAEQIKTASSKVKSGADFPAYIKEIKLLGVTHYETYVSDGHVNYHGDNDYIVRIPAKYAPLLIADTTKKKEFKRELKAHQQGKTDFLTFIKMCADTGIKKWEICMDKMTCSYFDKGGNKVLVEKIPPGTQPRAKPKPMCLT